MADDSRVFKIDLQNLHQCLACPLEECGYLRHYLAPQCPIIWPEISKKTEQKRRCLARKKVQSIQVEA